MKSQNFTVIFLYISVSYCTHLSLSTFRAAKFHIQAYKQRNLPPLNVMVNEWMPNQRFIKIKCFFTCWEYILLLEIPFRKYIEV